MSEHTKAFTDVSSQVDVSKLEAEVLLFWERERIFEKSLALTEDSGKGQYTFYDGPPYATGKPHYGHILQAAIKDTVLRYRTMQGYFVPRRVGWDCHGLPVETIVEQELGFTHKKDIEEYGIEKFNAKCRETVLKYVDVFTATLKRIGRWSDYDTAYFTLERDYMESEWWVFHQLWKQQLVYQAFRSTPYCVRCETPLSNFEVASNYRDTTDTAVYVGLRVKSGLPHKDSPGGESTGLHKQLSLLVWTTTPWTLPGNVAVAVGSDIAYVEVEHEGKRYIMARDRVKAVFSDATFGRTWTAEELTTLQYEPLYTSQGVDSSLTYRVVLSDHVTAEDGTGLVHIAPAFGEEDAAVGARYDLPVLRTVDTTGHFNRTAPEFLQSRHIFDGNALIVDDLRERNLLFKEEQYTHSYPFCWRCETPLIYYALDTWFVKVADLKERMLANNQEHISWTPEHIKHGRFAKGIESAPDWAVSRNRFWSVPVPVWECDEADCTEQVCVGSLEELRSLTGKNELPDIHRPYVDELSWQCTVCSGTMHRVPEVLDVWFDSGSMPYAQWHYPFDHKDLVEAGFPADFIVESVEQTRLWFYVLHVIATALTGSNAGLSLGVDQPAFKHAVGSGLLFAEDGQKLSKKLKNYPELEPTIEAYGADVLRLYLLSSASLGEPYRFSEKDLRQLQRTTYLRLWNVYSFFVRYANTHDWVPPDSDGTPSDDVLDRWILARLSSLELNMLHQTEHYEVDNAARSFIRYVDDLSNWYVRRSRQRFQKPASEAAKEQAFSTLHGVLVRTAKIVAPYMPFVAEEMYRNLTGDVSVHLQQLPDPTEAANRDTAEEHVIVRGAMDRVRDYVAQALAIRAAAGIKVRQPLAGLYVVDTSFADVSQAAAEKYDAPLDDSLVAIICDEVNVKEVMFVDQLPDGDRYAWSSAEGRVRVALDVELTDELMSEGLAREIIRRGQVLRREAGYALDDTITLVFATEAAELAAVMDQQQALIVAALQVDAVVAQSDQEDAGADVTLAGHSLHLGVVRNT